MFIKFFLSVISLFLLSYSQMYSQLNPEWVQTYNGSGNGNDESLSHITDDSGNVYAAGKIFQTASLFDIYVVKYNVPGNKIWERIYNGPGNGNDIANSIALDLNGNIYVAGESKGDSTGGDFILIKYDGNGNEMWNRRFDGESSSTDAVIKVVTDNSGFPIVSGTSFNLNTLFDIVTIRYDPEGNIVWNKMYNGSSNRNEFIGDMAIDDSGNVFISGSSFVQGEGDNFLLIKYSNNGDQLWTADYNGPSGANDNITSLTLDNNGNAVISGSSVAPGTGIDFATLKYSGSGQELWLRRYSSSAISSPDEPKAIISDIHGNIFVTGASVQSNSYDYLTVKYSSSGDELWTRRYNGPSGNNFDEPRSLTTDISGNVFVAGLSQGTGTMDDMVIIKYDSTGNQIWLNRYNSAVNRNDVANNISIDISGNITVSGFIAGTSSLNDFAVVRFSQLTNLFQHYNQNATDYYLFQNYPNPFNPSTVIGFSIPSESKINLSVYNSLGKIVRTLQNGYLKPGLYSYKFNSSGLSGGIYFYTLKTDKQTITRKMLLIK